MENDEWKIEPGVKPRNLVSRILNPRADLSRLRQTRPVNGVWGWRVRLRHILNALQASLGTSKELSATGCRTDTTLASWLES